jgi:hypothetical protein
MPRENLKFAGDFERWMTERFGSDRDFYPVDLEAVLAGPLDPPEPTTLVRSDGKKLLYDNMLHWVASEPEAGKSWLALMAVKECIESGRGVVYFDYEMSPEDVVRRLVLIGANTSDIIKHLTYIRPPGKMSNEVLQFYGTPTDDAPAMFAGVALVVFDACTEAMTADGFDPLSQTDVAAWLQRAPRLALRMGSMVLVLDHVTKSRETQGRWAIGAQHKMAQTDVHYSLHAVRPFAPGLVGMSTVKVEKDRPGGVRAFALGGEKVGTLVLNSEDSLHVEAFISPPPTTATTGASLTTDYSALVLGAAAAQPMSRRALESLNGGRSTAKRNTVEGLILAGQLVPSPDDVAAGRAHPKWVVG